MNYNYQALRVTEVNGTYERKIISLNTGELQPQDLLIRVSYSSVNYKDALSASGNRGVTRHFPHVPGIDAAGEVVSSNTAGFQAGDKVLVTGFDLGMNTWGGFGGYIAVPAGWVLPLPENLTEKEAMSLGTAGLTAGLSVQQLLKAGIRPDAGKLLVSGASGGVGSIAVAILSKLGYQVAVITGKPDPAFFIDILGAQDIIARNEFIAKYDARPMAAAQFAAGIDSVGGPVLSGMLKSVSYGSAVTTCGMVASTELHTSIFPFILRGARLIGIDSVEVPLQERSAIWQKLAGEWKPGQLAHLTREISLETLSQELDDMLAGKAKGRAVLKHQHSTN